MLDNVINVRMLSHPINWLIVWTVLLFAGFAFSLVHDRLHPSTVMETV